MKKAENMSSCNATNENVINQATLESVLAGEHRWVVLEQDNAELLQTLPDKTFDVVLTDPPYDEKVHKYGRSTSTWKDVKPVGIKEFDYLADPALLAPQLVRLAKQWAIAFCALEDLAAYRDGLGDKEWVRSGIWDKVVPGPQISADRPGNAAEGIAIMHRKGESVGTVVVARASGDTCQRTARSGSITHAPSRSS